MEFRQIHLIIGRSNEGNNSDTALGSLLIVETTAQRPLDAKRQMIFTLKPEQ